MKKKLFLMLLAASMLCSSAPAYAAETLPSEWEAPFDVTVTDATEEGGQFCLTVGYTIGADHSDFAYDIVFSGDYAKYGLTEPVSASSWMQIDWRIDGGGWHYDPLWDTADETRLGADEYLYYRVEAPYGSEQKGRADILRLPSREDWDSDYLGWRTELSAQGVGDMTESGSGDMLLDLSDHTVDVRLRLITAVSAAEFGGEARYILSPWSETVSIGKGVVVAAEKPTALPTPSVSSFSVEAGGDDGSVYMFNLSVPGAVKKLCADALALKSALELEAQVKLGDGEWADLAAEGDLSALVIADGAYACRIREPASDGVTATAGIYQLRARYLWRESGASTELYSRWSAPLTFNSAGWTASEWAVAELMRADKLGLIPESLSAADLTKPITRREFAAVSLRAYELLSGAEAIPDGSKPFSDCDDADVLKAYAVGITAGIDGGKFAPDRLLSRQEAATMLTRVYKKVTMSGWTLTDDASFKLSYTKPAAFADDAAISPWAYDSVYFMAANGIIKGMDGNRFAPYNTTAEEETRGLANAQRQQALAIAVRMAESMRG